MKLKSKISKIVHSFTSTQWKLFSVVWTIILLFLSLLSSQQASKLSIDLIGFDKLAHLIFYCILCFSWMMALVPFKYKHFVIFTAIVTLGIMVEFAQLRMGKGRSYEYYDMLANTAGTLMGIYLFGKLSHNIRNEAIPSN
ncbi:MAG: VanZ family protein [Lewinellaceae bacterium]|nr:VanZ family protein [Lewinellaceae bacterium]